MSSPRRIGLISDTHGLLRPEAVDALAGVDRIVHAGDVGSIDVLEGLQSLAPLTAVYGNADPAELRALLGETATLVEGGARTLVVHGHQLGSPTPARLAESYSGAELVVFGHSHRPVVADYGSTLIVNPGSAGARRFRNPVTIALAEIRDGLVQARIVPLNV